MSSLAEVAERALEGAGTEIDTLVTVRRGRSLRVEAEAGARVTARRGDETRLEVLCVREGQAARSATTDLTLDSVTKALASAASAAAELARAFGPGAHPGLPEPTPARAHEGYDPATARHELPALEGLHEGAYESRSVEIGLASSRGLRAAERATAAELEVGTGSAVLRSAAVAARDIDVAGMLAHEPDSSLSAVTSVAAGEYPAVLSAGAVAAVLDVLGRTAFNGMLHAENRGPLAGRLGRRVAAPSINLSDSPRFPSTVPRSYDAEGVAKAPIPLIQDGVAHRVVHDLTSASRAGGAAASTGHATGALAGPAPRNLVLVGGGVSSEQELAGPVGQGLLVAGLDAVEITDPSTASFTACLAPGSRLVENGRVSGLLGAITVGASALDLLSCVEALTATPRLVLKRTTDPHAYPHGTVCPALRISAITLG